MGVKAGEGAFGGAGEVLLLGQVQELVFGLDC
jgi:hypothetical protein